MVAIRSHRAGAWVQSSTPPIQVCLDQGCKPVLCLGHSASHLCSPICCCYPGGPKPVTSLPALRPQRAAWRLRLGLEKNHTGMGGWMWGKLRCFFVGAGCSGVFRFCNPGRTKRNFTGTGESYGLGYVLLFRAGLGSRAGGGGSCITREQGRQGSFHQVPQVR